MKNQITENQKKTLDYSSNKTKYLEFSHIFNNKFYKFNDFNYGDGLDFMENIVSNTIALVIFDPQYRGILDKLKYGNEGKTKEKQRCLLSQMDENTIIKFIKEINRIIKPSGHLFLWTDKFHLCEGSLNYWIGKTELNLVDMVVWDKDKMGMGYRTRRQTEFLLIFQKSPKIAKNIWKQRNIRDIWKEKVNKKAHPHSKPINLQKTLISSITNKDDIILDPAAGSFSVLEACKLSKRTFIGIELNENIK